MPPFFGTEVEFKDTRGRHVKFALNSACFIDLWVEKKLKVQQVTQVRCVGPAVHFEGKRIMYTAQSIVARPADVAALDNLILLCNKARLAFAEHASNLCYVLIRRGEQLRAADIGGKSDPYCVIRVPGKAGAIQTSYVSRSLNPQWGESFQIPSWELGDALNIEVMDRDFIGKDDYLGTVSIAPELLSKGGCMDLACDLYDDKQHKIKSAVRGKIFVRVEIVNGDPVNYSRRSEKSQTAAPAPPTTTQVPELPPTAEEIAEDKWMSEIVVSPEGSEAKGSKKKEIYGQMFDWFGAVDGRMDATGLQRFAKAGKFTGDASEWAIHVAEICMVAGINLKQGIDFENFCFIANTKGDMGNMDAVAVEKFFTCAQKGEPAERRTWRSVSTNFKILRSFGVALKKRFENKLEAFLFWSPDQNKTINEEEFVEGLRRLGSFEGDVNPVFALVSLGSYSIGRRHFRWVWKLLDPEEEILGRRVVECETSAAAVARKISMRNAAVNSAFVFIKPHAVTEATANLVREVFEAKCIRILSEGSLSGKEIDEGKLIDQHYYSIASKATILKPHELNVPEDVFQAHFGVSWQDTLASGRVFNAMEGCEVLGIDGKAMDEAWAACKSAGKCVKLGGGFYCGLVEVSGKDPVEGDGEAPVTSAYIFNGFFMSMRSKFTAPDSEIRWFNVEWDSTSLSWADFRGQVLGPTDPAQAAAGSLRGQIFAEWQTLGLLEQPNVGDNGVHASASPFEGLAERCNWLGKDVAQDPFGHLLLKAGVADTTIKAWSLDPQVTYETDKQKSIFDLLEDMDVQTCVDKVASLARMNAVTEEEKEEAALRIQCQYRQRLAVKVVEDKKGLREHVAEPQASSNTSGDGSAVTHLPSTKGSLVQEAGAAYPADQDSVELKATRSAWSKWSKPGDDLDDGDAAEAEVQPAGSERKASISNDMQSQRSKVSGQVAAQQSARSAHGERKVSFSTVEAEKVSISNDMQAQRSKVSGQAEVQPAGSERKVSISNDMQAQRSKVSGQVEARKSGGSAGTERKVSTADEVASRRSSGVKSNGGMAHMAEDDMPESAVITTKSTATAERRSIAGDADPLRTMKSGGSASAERKVSNADDAASRRSVKSNGGMAHMAEEDDLHESAVITTMSTASPEQLKAAGYEVKEQSSLRE